MSVCLFDPCVMCVCWTHSRPVWWVCIRLWVVEVGHSVVVGVGISSGRGQVHGAKRRWESQRRAGTCHVIAACFKNTQNHTPVWYGYRTVKQTWMWCNDSYSVQPLAACERPVRCSASYLENTTYQPETQNERDSYTTDPFIQNKKALNASYTTCVSL